MKTRLKWLLTVAQSSTVMPRFFVDEHAQCSLRRSVQNRPVRSPGRAGFFEDGLDIMLLPMYIIKKWPRGHFSSKLKNRRNYNRFYGEMKVLIYFVFLGRKKADVKRGL